jgi:salicylate hydroxylase
VVAYVTDEEKAGTSFEGHWVSTVSPEEVQESYRDFEPAVKQLLEASLGLYSPCCPRLTIFLQCFENPSRWALQVVNELPLAVYDRVGLIGDAVRFFLLTM